MSEDWSNLVWISVSLLIGVAIVTIMLNLSYIGRQISTALYTERAMVEEIRDYRETAPYDGETVYAQDIVSLIFKNRGEPEVVVKTGKGTLRWNLYYASTEYTSEAITTAININKMYDGVVERDASGAVLRFVFTEKG